MSDFDYEIRYLDAAQSELESYLLSDKLFWPIGIRARRGVNAYPELTLGNMLISQRRAAALAGSSEQYSDLEHITTQIGEIRAHWQSAWNKKASQEYRSRFKLWQKYLEDYRVQPDANWDRYAYEVSRRVILELLSSEAGDILDGEMVLLNGLDGYLKSILIESDFLWAEELLSAFPKNPYWYLYGKLQE